MLSVYYSRRCVLGGAYDAGRGAPVCRHGYVTCCSGQ